MKINIVSVIVLCLTAFTAFALDEIPSELVGRWDSVNASGGDVRNGKVSVRIDDQKAGVVKGIMNWGGGRQCELRDAPMEGSWDGTTLVLRATFTSPVAFSSCAGPTEFILKRTANGNFDGDTKRFPNYKLTVSLSPKVR